MHARTTHYADTAFPGHAPHAHRHPRQNRTRRATDHMNDLDIPMPLMATMHTSSGAHPLRVGLANTFLTRFTGLMFSRPLAPRAALLLMHCPSVHTAFMRQTIDVVYIDSAGQVVRCVSRLRPWRCSIGNAQAVHALELAAGTIERLGIRCGDRLQHAVLRASSGTTVYRQAYPKVPPHQRGASMIEFAVVGPVLTLMGLAILQYGMLFFAKNQINHATFMAARAGASANASLEAVRNAYVSALVPIYGGGRNTTELAAAHARAQNDIASNVRIELLNPTRQSFDDWNDPALQQALGIRSRVIPNNALAFRDPAIIRSGSAQNIHDANLVKLRITHGYELKVPLMEFVYGTFLRWLDTGNDAFHTRLVRANRIPIDTHVTLHMQSDAIEGETVLEPDMDRDSNPSGPRDPAGPNNTPPNCLTIACTVRNVPVTPLDPGGGGDGGGGGCHGDTCPTCNATPKP
jgi:uncharacterized membrane protein (UPF0127 family)